ncbi:hypothetical protein GeomeDRAFT_1222 [Geobacter metallireducens RCH3]|uniref:Glycosyltransferase n=1 Tax=Geobacter metallireducens (strain ATCC 53774 / DSM 7210 / GS-15) TaxID=269799 RepID=Q39Q86_GEOMG|nr:hypothetical protein [Geobacter metallireducens]ABB33588.1 hypothetical protein Gmet_3376 [Geobacter metallireducens GS-15]EHP87698.1 hypothetical protein GeomeDRAFT_1222 [Geobacter metallireducens RCH3]
MKKILLILLAMAVTALAPMGTTAYAAEHSHAVRDKGATTVTARADLQAGLRDLWIGHVFWVRNVALTTKYGDSTAAAIAEGKVVENAKAIAASIEPFYGKPASDKLFGLLAGHYGAVKAYMTASYAGDKAGKEAAKDKLVKNADEIAAFLSGANPYLPRETLKTLLYAHGGHHMAQLDALAGKDFAQEAKVWDDMKDHMYVIADALAGGLAKQFPKMIR